MIAIFPEDSDVEDIWTKLQGKLGITDADISKIGDDKFYVEFRKTADLVRNELNGLIMVHAGHKHGTIEEITNALKFKQQVKKDLVEECIDLLEIGKIEDEKDYREIVFPNIENTLPLIICSDNHNILNYKLKVPCWIKADPTFAGLKQVINEPIDRVFLGELPDSIRRVELNKTKYIDKLIINKIANSQLKEKWFDCEVPFNNELVAIIGNKGSGKSALTDILGLLGNSKNTDFFSFLNGDKFKQPKENKAVKYEATITWMSGISNKASLNADVSREDVEIIKYIPQHYLEEICTELKDLKKTNFDKELKSVIFSHVGEVNRLSQSSLDGMITYKTKEIYREIDILKNELHEINQQIVSLEGQLTDENRRSIQNQLELKKEELRMHDTLKPKVVIRPETNPDMQKTSDGISKEIILKNQEKELIDIKIGELTQNQALEVKRYSVTEKLLAEIDNIERQYNSFAIICTKYLSELGIHIEDIINLSINREPINSIKQKIRQKIKESENLLDQSNEISFAKKRAKLDSEIDELREKLDEPNKQYQFYLRLLTEWEIQRSKIVGNEKIIGSINNLIKALKILDEMPKLLKDIKEKRIKKTLEIYWATEKICDVYRSLYSPVQEFIANHKLAKDRFDLEFKVSIVSHNFDEQFFEYISHGVRGSFCGKEEGKFRLRSIIDKSDFESGEGIYTFLDDIMCSLIEDKRQIESPKMIINNQLRQTVEMIDLYDYLFSLAYLIPKYSLQYSGKDLDQLSPGERGTLLLIFYLLIDNSDIPLIIDQPEENLDNQTVFDILVPCIKEAKKKRQIIIVTHNPNLAVVCDADQIIYSSIDKKDGNSVNYETGAIENPTINKHIVDILEGTMPAFDNRDKKYQRNS
jgi:ABC-type lipoprotein export system ATPase subunit